MVPTSSSSSSRLRGTTAENAARTLPLLRERGVARAVVVCAPTHLARTRLLFGRLYRSAGVDTAFRAPAVAPTPALDRVGARGVPVPAGATPRSPGRGRAALAMSDSRRLHPGLERGGEPARRPRGAARAAARRGRPRRRRRLDRPHGRGRPRAWGGGALPRDEPGPARRDRRRLPLGARARLRVLRAGRRRRPASRGRARAAARARAQRRVRRRGRLPLRVGGRLRAVPLPAEPGPAPRHRAAAAFGRGRPAAALPGRDERPLRREREGAAAPRPARTRAVRRRSRR